MAIYEPKTDKNQLFIRIMDIIVWCLIFAAMIFFDQARPETRTILDMRYSKDIREIWDYTYASISMWIFIIASIICSIGLLINITMLTNKKYHLSYGLSIGLIVSIGSAAVYIFILL